MGRKKGKRESKDEGEEGGRGRKRWVGRGDGPGQATWEPDSEKLMHKHLLRSTLEVNPWAEGEDSYVEILIKASGNPAGSSEAGGPLSAVPSWSKGTRSLLGAAPCP